MVFTYRVLKKQHCWNHKNYTVSCDFCRRI